MTVGLLGFLERVAAGETRFVVMEGEALAIAELLDAQIRPASKEQSVYERVKRLIANPSADGFVGLLFGVPMYLKRGEPCQ